MFRTARLIALSLAMVCVMAAVWSCSPKTAPPVTLYHERTDLRQDSLYRYIWLHDSTVYRDTVRIEVRGDTVFRDVIKWRILWRLRTDTLVRWRERYVTVHDSVDRPVPYPVTKTVYKEKPPSAWSRFTSAAFWPLLAALTSAIFYIFRKPLLKLMCRLKM